MNLNRGGEETQSNWKVARELALIGIGTLEAETKFGEKSEDS